LEQEDPAPKYSLIHTGEIREKLSRRGYYISSLGIILNDKDDNYSLGDIRYTCGLRRLLGKEEVIVSEGTEKERNKLIRILEWDKIPFRKTKVQRIKRD
jgi:hypothetical protein